MTDREQIEAARAAMDEMERGPDESMPHDVDMWYCERRETIRNASIVLMRRVEELEAWQREAVKILQMVRQDEMLFAACNGLDEHEPSTVCILIAQAKPEEVVGC